MAINQTGPVMPRIVAVVLALGASAWGILLILVLGWEALIFPPTTIGYLVTAGYFTRAVYVPPLGIRKAIWIASIVVQGGWFLVTLTGMLSAAHPSNALPMMTWLTIATVSSVVAFVGEHETMPA